MDDLTKIECNKYRRMWDKPIYWKYSPGELLAPQMFDLFDLQIGDSLVDYGCGSGKAIDYFRNRGLNVSGIDLIPLRDDVIEACLWDLPEIKSDWAFCVDVMEHIPPEKVDDVLKSIQERTYNGAMFVIALGKDAMGKEIGEILHLTCRPVDWWIAVLEKYWPNVNLHGKGTTKNSYIFACSYQRKN